MTAQRTQTVRDLLRSALPMGTRIVAGGKGLNRIVTWTSVLHTRPPAFPSLEGRELALLSIDALHLLSDKLTLADIINDLAQVDVAAVGVIGSIDNRARLAAEENAIPLLNLPQGTSLRQVERDVVKVLVGPPPSPELRGQEVHEQLLQLSTENKGMAALVGAIADMTGRTVVVQDKRFETVVAVGGIHDRDDWEEIEAQLSNEETIPALFRNRVEVAQIAPEPALIEMPEFALKRLVIPIVANRMGRGFFSLILDTEVVDPLDVQFARHGAAVCALEMAKEKAIREAQKKVQGGLLERLILGTVPVDQALRQLQRLGHNPVNTPYTAIVASWGHEDSPSDRRLETIFNEQVNIHHGDALVQLLEGSVVVFCVTEPTVGKAIPRSLKQFAESVMARVKSQYPNARLALGIGRPVLSLNEWRTSYQEALATQRIAQQWHVYQPLYFADLGVYRLLSLLLETPELRSFYRETLGDLADEKYANDEFISTLETFFEEHGNLSQTANKLHVHRNTLLYRMERIEQIGAFDLDNPETRLAVFLALKIRRLLAEVNMPLR
ncbi:MAG: helix-turn-helix domain-containing protein [Anaerolineae bacterium]|nr:helix-turn-helix domain-containing protein [Anaerolineae bacterium]